MFWVIDSNREPVESFMSRFSRLLAVAAAPVALAVGLRVWVGSI